IYRNDPSVSFAGPAIQLPGILVRCKKVTLFARRNLTLTMCISAHFSLLHSLRRCTILWGQQTPPRWPLCLLYARLGRFLPKLGPCLSRPLFLAGRGLFRCVFGQSYSAAKGRGSRVSRAAWAISSSRPVISVWVEPKLVSLSCRTSSI